jgi:lipopolysaccharide biosynthesis glycosyltransferase
MRTTHVFISDQSGYRLARYAMLSLALAPGGERDIRFFGHGFDASADGGLRRVIDGLGCRYKTDVLGPSSVEHHRTYGHVTAASLLRLAAIRRLAEAYDRVVCLDTDILAFGDPAFEALDLAGMPLGAVVEMDLSPKGPYRDWTGATAAPGDRYFNAGVMVFDTTHWPADEIEAEYARLLAEHETGCSLKVDCTSPEQCALNHMFRGRWAALPLDLNMQAGTRGLPAWRNARLRHYLGTRKFLPLKPWRSDARQWDLVSRVAGLLGDATEPRPWWQPLALKANRLRQAGYAARMGRFLADTAPPQPTRVAR